MRYALNRPHESSDHRSSGNDKNRCRCRCRRIDRPPADDSSLWLISRRTLLHRMRAPSRFRLRRSRTAECILVRIELILFGSSLFALRIFPALASAVTVALAGMLARELGGRVWAITLACTGMLGR